MSAPVVAQDPSAGPGDLPAVDDVALPWLLDRAPAWDRLVHEAERPRPFYARSTLVAHAAHGSCRHLRAIVVRRGERLLALLPYRAASTRIGLLGRANAAWTSPYTTSSDPLVAADALGPGVAGLLDGIGGTGRLWLLPQLTLESRAGLALRQGAVARGWGAGVLDRFDRAVLGHGPRRPDGTAAAPGPPKGLGRRRRRLEELGPVAFGVATDGAELDAAVEAFLSLEAAGWKGRRGTALASRPQGAALARDLFARAGDGVSGRADILTLDGRPIAVGLSMIVGGTAHLWKAAYDESLARVAPGLLLEHEIVRAFHVTAFAERLDSAAPAGSHMDRVLSEREAVGDLLISIDPDSLPRLLGAERLRRSLAAKVKTLASRWRTWAG